MTVTKLLADSLINFKILFQKILELIVFLILWSSLFHSITVDIKKEISLVLKKGMLCIFLVTEPELLEGISLMR